MSAAPSAPPPPPPPPHRRVAAAAILTTGPGCARLRSMKPHMTPREVTPCVTALPERPARPPM